MNIECITFPNPEGFRDEYMYTRLITVPEIRATPVAYHINTTTYTHTLYSRLPRMIRIWHHQKYLAQKRTPFN
jgi:hypothetical protein